MCTEGIDEVVGVFFVVVFDAKVINCGGELNRLCDMFPEAGCMWDLLVSQRS